MQEVQSNINKFLKFPVRDASVSIKRHSECLDRIQVDVLSMLEKKKLRQLLKRAA